MALSRMRQRAEMEPSDDDGSDQHSGGEEGSEYGGSSEGGDGGWGDEGSGREDTTGPPDVEQVRLRVWGAAAFAHREKYATGG